SSRWPIRWNNVLVGSFHQPPDILDPLVANKAYIRRLDAAFVLSRVQEEYFRGLLPDARIFYVPHGVDVNYWSPDPTGRRSPEPTFLFVGWWLRDFDVLRETIRRVNELEPRVRFEIVTFERFFDSFRGLRNTRVRCGIPDEELLALYRGARALLLPLKAATANTALLDSMACGTPVITTRTGGVPEYVDPACGSLLPPGDVDGTVEAVRRMAEDSRLQETAARAAREQALKFRWETIGEQTNYIYRRLLGQDASAHYRAERPGPRTLCLITEEYPPETGWGGIATYNRNLAQGLAGAGHRVVVIAGTPGAPSETREGNIEIHRVRFEPRHPWVRSVYDRRIKPYLRTHALEFLRRFEFALAAYKRFRRLERQFPIHLVEAPEYYGSALLVQLRSATPVVVKCHTPTEVNCHLNRIPVTRDIRLCNLFEKNSVRLAARVTSPSRKMARIVLDRWLRRRGEIELLEYPIDPEQYRPASGNASGRRFFLFTGRLERRKGVDLLVQAFDRVSRDLPDFDLHLAGHDTPTFGSNGEALTFHDYLAVLPLREETRPRIRFLGRLSLGELIPHYQAAYACVVPSVSFENFPNACLEAMACGRPVVVTDQGGTVEMVEHGVSGLHVPAGDVEALAGSLRYLGEHAEDAERIGRAAREVVLERYATPRIIERTLALYERVIARARYR
ncbi:MAG TPA: glycosyltransferase, partial [Planctomycetota bacterium]|nr:glycosyltransferase [Planctomycetota bacterium]